MGKRVVILGGGLGGLSTAWQITKDPNWRDTFESVDVYQMGWRLGGKCATGRGPMRRIEEHGIHLFGGGYYNALPMMREVFDALHGSPEAGQAAFDQAFDHQFTSVRVGPDARKLVVRLKDNALSQEALAAMAHTGQLHRWLAAALGGLRNYLVDADDPPAGPAQILTADLGPVLAALKLGSLPHTPPAALARVDALILALDAGQLADARQHAGELKRAADGLWPALPGDSLQDAMRKLIAALAPQPQLVPLGRVLFAWALVLDFIAALVLAWLQVIESTTTLESLDQAEYHAGLMAHGARLATTQSDLVMGPIRILYQFRDGDPKRPSLGAGCFLHWILRSFAFGKAPFWYFREGTGETLIKPLYQLLVQRGVQFHFFHRVESINPGAAGRSLQSITFRVQADLLPGQTYQPLDRGCWPDRPLLNQLLNGDELAALPADELESYWSRYREGHTTTLTVTPADDAVVLAIPPAALPAIAPALLAQSAALRGMAGQVASVETQGLQLWLDADSASLGVNTGSSQPIQADDTFLGAGFVDGFHTFSDFSPLIPHEAWPADRGPRALWYFADTLPTPPGLPDLADPHYPARRQALARRAARQFTLGALGMMLPDGKAAPMPPSFDPQHLVVPDETRVTDPASRFDQQWVRANCQPSERYVQALAGTTQARLHAGKAPDYCNLYLAGDWTYNGLNVGCVEATVMSGKLAGNALLQTLDPAVGVVGYFPR